MDQNKNELEAAEAAKKEKLLALIKDRELTLIDLGESQVIIDCDHKVLDVNDEVYEEILKLIKPIKLAPGQIHRTPDKLKSKSKAKPKALFPAEETTFSSDDESNPADDVPIPPELISMSSKMVKEALAEALKINPAPKVSDGRDRWHEFLSRFHAQWAAQGFPNTENTAMHLSAMLGTDEVLRWTQGHKLQDYLQFLNYSNGKAESLQESTSLVTFVLFHDRELTQNWTMFANKASAESTEKVHLIGTKELRTLFEQKVKGTVFADAWYNAKLNTRIHSDGSNWLNFVKLVQADHAYPRKETKLLPLNPKGQEYQRAKAIADQGTQCIACNALAHQVKDCPLIKLFREARPNVFRKDEPGVPKKQFYCLAHGQSGNHETKNCYAIQNMAKNPQSYREKLLKEKDKPSSEKKKDRRGSNTSAGNEKKEIEELIKRNEELETKILTINLNSLKKRNRELEILTKDTEPSSKKPKTASRNVKFRDGQSPSQDEDDEMVTITVLKKSLNMQGSE
jgi:hypothetical protein